MTKNRIKEIIKKAELNKEKQKEFPFEKEYDVLLKIYELTEINNEFAYLEKLASETNLNPKEVNNCLNKLFNCSFINGTWEEHVINNQSQFMRVYYVNDILKNYAKTLYERKNEQAETTTLKKK